MTTDEPLAGGEPAPALRMPMPGRLVGVLIFVVVQAVLNGLFGVLLAVEISDAESHGQKLVSPELAYAAEYVSFAAAVLLVVSAVVVSFGVVWGRNLLVVLEAVIIVNGVVMLISGAPLAVAGIVLAGLTISVLLHDTVKAWMDYKSYHRGIG
ncbi:hypothetical protein [Amycolatopsis sp. CA-230715]|uniref:hypothetical protein n=1 Tax=Amycolatopsis sp. CA-230715 TaxID=2745196 RepID=UPI001C025F34|nr:hypothetical protein [Amycolatopsis sp. CA-230715]QWF82568.1 hypothetical protein HUW46_06006 [Amycolatopsis sp. CA-230715]